MKIIEHLTGVEAAKEARKCKMDILAAGAGDPANPQFFLLPNKERTHFRLITFGMPEEGEWEILTFEGDHKDMLHISRLAKKALAKGGVEGRWV